MSCTVHTGSGACRRPPKQLRGRGVLIEKGKYFTINRARQHGKTTMLQAIRRKLSDELKTAWHDDAIKDFSTLGKAIATFCQSYPRPVALLIDEADKSSDDEPQWAEHRGKCIF